MSTISSTSSISTLSNLHSMPSVRSGRENDSDSDDGGASSVTNKGSNFMHAIEKAFASLGISSTSSSSSSSSTSTANSTDASQGAQAAMAFMQNLMATLQQAGGNNGSNPPPPPPDSGSNVDSTGRPSFTQDQLASMANSLASTDPTRAAEMTKIANNFSQADTNGDGKVSAQEAMAFDKTFEQLEQVDYLRVPRRIEYLDRYSEPDPAIVIFVQFRLEFVQLEQFAPV